MTGAADVITLPTGGGALAGIGETFAPDPHTGTGNFSVPIALPPGRNTLQPHLALAYSTAAGNGPFGLGWSLSLPGVRRSTGRGVPRYDEPRDRFVLSGAEDLVQVEHVGPTTRYRPRTEGVFASILRHRDGGDDYWQVSGKDGLVSTYGTPGGFGADPAVVADPADRSRVLSWEITRTADSFGNHIAYEHLRDSGTDGPHHWDQLYPQRIRYVDHGSEPADPQYLVSVSFEYAERPDPFSERRAGFEVRTRLRCTRIVVRSHAGADRLIRSYGLRYADTEGPVPNGVSLLARVDLTGHDGQAAGATSQAMPPLVFGYSGFRPGTRTFQSVRGRELPATSLDDPTLDLVDLAGNGLPDLVQLDGVARHWRNLGDGTFDVPRRLRGVPGGLSLADPRVAFADADGNGRADLMVTSGALAGYFPIRPEVGWDGGSFRRFRHAPSFDLADAEVRLVDLDGDGVTDAVRSGSRLECFFNDPVEGWSRMRRVSAGPSGLRFSFADPRVRWADLTGDGLQDVAVLHDGSVAYWPNLGHGDWGPPVTMRNAPRLPSGYDPARLLLGDVDGDGLADLVYVGDDDVTLWVNRCGDAWSDPVTVRARDGDAERSYRGTPPLAGGDVRLVDLLGTGMVGVLWSRDARTSAGASMFFLDFTGGVKPYLLERMDNSIGAVTEVEYASSSRYFAEDDRDRETRWRTTLPFPVHVVAGSVVRDRFSGGALHTGYRYRHGHWDGAEREFRGFAMVEQRDAEVRTDGGPVPEFFSPPTLSRTWFHAGPVGDESGGWAALDLSGEYWPGDPGLLDPPTIPPQVADPRGRRARRDALRALRGSVLRTERYAEDGDPRADRPYTVSEATFAVHEVEPPAAGEDRLRAFFPHAVADRSTRWERGDDPMTALTFISYLDAAGDFDPFGRPRASTEVACPRGWRDREDRPAEPFLARHTRTEYAVPLDPTTYAHDRVSATTTFDLPGTAGRTLTEVVAATLAPGDDGLRLEGHTVTHYDGEAFVGLPRGQLGEHGQVVRTTTLVLTEEILVEAYGAQRPPYLTQGGPADWDDDYPAEFRTLLAPGAGYLFRPGGADPLREPGGWYSTDSRRRYDWQSDPPAAPRGLLMETRDPLWRPGDPDGHRATVGYDTYQTVPVRATDALGLSVEADYDYRVFQPRRVTDPNGRETRYTFTPLGFLASTAVSGQHADEGDWAEPGARLEYDFTAVVDSPAGNPRPIHVRTVRRIHHDTDVDVPLPERDATIITMEFSDGFGRLLQTRVQREDVRFDGTGDVLVGVAAEPGTPNVVVSGHQVHDNKGRVVEAYEPYLSAGFAYRAPDGPDIGTKVVAHHDPLGRPRLSTQPDGSQELVVQGVPGNIAEPRLSQPDQFEPTPWESYTYDANDNAGRTHPAASASYAHHHDTPASVRVDARGRAVEAVARHRDAVGPIREDRVFTTYDSRGNTVQVTDQLGRLAEGSVYDLANRPLRVVAADSGTRVACYDAAGVVVERRDGRGALVVNGQDRVNRPVRSWARNPAGPVVLVARTEYGDGGRSDQPAAERAAARAAYRLTRPHRQWDGAGRVDLLRYDFTGVLVEKSRRVVADTVLADGPPTLVDWTTPGAVPLDPDEYALSLRFDALGRVRTMTLPEAVDGVRRSIVARYNRAGALDGVDLERPSAGGPVRQTFVERAGYDAKGQRNVVVLGNGLLSRCDYDPATRRLARLRTERFTRPDALTYRFVGPGEQDVGYSYDLAGNVVAISDRTPGCGVPNTPLGPDRLDRAFGYDSLYRLTGATGRECDGPLPVPWEGSPRCSDVTRARAYTESYRYDAVGNLTELKHLTGGAGVTRTLDRAGDANGLGALTAGGLSVAYLYDGNGNLLQEGLARFFEWDHGDRLVGYRTQAGAGPASLTARYAYDGAGQRVKKVVRAGGKITVTTYIDGVFERRRVASLGAEVRNDTIHVNDDRARVATVRVGPPFPGDATPAVQYHLADHLGSSTAVLDATGSPVTREEFTPYGETAFGGSATKRYRHGGKERDEETGLSYYGFRYYAPWLCRWVSPDPAGRKDGPNLYQFVRGNPMRLTDPTGLQSNDSSGGIGTDLTNTPAAEDSSGGPPHAAPEHHEAEHVAREERAPEPEAPPPAPVAAAPAPRPPVRSPGPASSKNTGDKVAEAVQTAVLRSIAATNPTGQLDMLTGGAISAMTKPRSVERSAW